MGCVSSKMVTRSSSFKEELRQSLKRRVRGFPGLEDLFVANKGDDQLLALVCTANTVTKKLQTGVPSQESRPSSEPCHEATKPETINAWELMEGLEEEKGEEDASVTRRTRLDVRCRSFHTVEEFDALVQSQDRGRHTRSRSVDALQEYEDKPVERNLWSQAEDKVCVILPAVEPEKIPVKDYQTVNETQDEDSCTVLGEYSETEVSSTDLVFAVSSESHPCQAEEACSVDDTAENNREEKGYRRRIKAKDLAALSIPTSTNIPAVGSLGEWLDLGAQTFPTRDYITPRFGSFSLPVPSKQSSSKDEVLFDPEMVAAFEESLKEMTAEEESVLRQIAEGLGEGEEEGITKQTQKENWSSVS